MSVDFYYYERRCTVGSYLCVKATFLMGCLKNYFIEVYFAIKLILKCNRFIDLCHCHHSLILEYFHSPQRNFATAVFTPFLQRDIIYPGWLRILNI